jgi:hypothetical protein
MPSSDPTPARVAARSLPYAIPFALGLGCLAWSLTELGSTFSDPYWVAAELLPPFVVLTVGTGLLFFGGVAARTLVERASSSS